MGVYVKEMNMPQDCIKCPFCLFTGSYWKCLVDGSHADFGGTCRPPGCPLVEVKTPHGRLVDFGDIKYKGYTEAEIISLFPTVIEEEE